MLRLFGIEIFESLAALVQELIYYLFLFCPFSNFAELTSKNNQR